ncbi:nitroreductase [Ktedonobacter sp. SOSP1-52]|uniref:nitroreductase family deazaflavin-dependent oxidoreductase n=1 Tax=Ktedonobacter sp. SOSP1-52 TaxID=2778366 RepID=UPI001915376D|nr:nitroreductase family deazaflavin-dependent oxidoreductase [Ktedonobacter sp. SOSP1-52]GHO62941.1 nitroreductase [Ktedonobacter sp. SOSP1-52]
MAKIYRHTFIRQAGNVLATTFARAGLKVGPIHLLTVRGRKSGQSRTTPIAVVEQNGQRYLVATFGIVNWVRNLRAAKEATLTLGRRCETISVVELVPEEAAPILKECIGAGGPITQGYFDVTAESSLQDFERETLRHPVFQILTKKGFSLPQAAGLNP